MDCANSRRRSQFPLPPRRHGIADQRLAERPDRAGNAVVAAITVSKALTIQSQSASVMTRGGSSLMVWLAWPATWVRILCSA